MVSWTCCASAVATMLTPAASRAINSRLENSSELNIALPHLLGEILRSPPRKRHDAERHVFVWLAHHRRRVAHEQVFDIVRLAVAVQHGSFGILAHARRAGLVDDGPARGNGAIGVLPLA